MSAHHQLIKDCLSFTGPLDPLKGDAVYVAIQSTAKETIDNLFNETLRNRTNFTRPVDSFAGASVSSQPQPGMQGIGGGSRAPAAPKDDWLSRAKGTFGGNPAAPAQPAQPAAAGPFGQPQPQAQPQQPQPTGRYGAPQPQAQPAQPAPAQPAQPAQQARAGGMFARKPAAAAAPVAAAPAYQPPVIKAGSAVTDGSYERKLVEELCTPQGMRPEPPKDKLARFAGACQTLDAAVVGPILLGKLADKNWKVVMKALYVIQEILNTPNTDGFKAYFKENTEEIQALGSYNHPMVKKMAGTVFDRVSRCHLGDEGEDEEEPEESFAAAPAPVAAAPADFGTRHLSFSLTRRLLRRYARAGPRARCGSGACARGAGEQRPVRVQRHVDRRRVLGPVGAARGAGPGGGPGEQRPVRVQHRVLHRRRLLRTLRADRRARPRPRARAPARPAAPAGQLRLLQHARAAAAAAAARYELRNARPAAPAAGDELWNARAAAGDELRKTCAAAPAAAAAGVDDELRFLWNVRRSRCFFAEMFVDKGGLLSCLL